MCKYKNKFPGHLFYDTGINELFVIKIFLVERAGLLFDYVHLTEINFKQSAEFCQYCLAKSFIAFAGEASINCRLEKV